MPGFDLVVVEGDLDAVVAKRLCHHLGVCCPEPVNKRGGSNFWSSAPKYNVAAKNGCLIFGLVDLGGDPCAPGLIARKLPQQRDPRFVLRVAHRMIESWLLADPEGIADFLGVSISKVDPNPESLAHPKLAIVSLARKSRKKRIVETLVPEAGMSGLVGKEYFPVMKVFTEKHWNPNRARVNSSSLCRAMDSIEKAMSTKI